MTRTEPARSFLDEPVETEAVRAFYAEDLAQDGFVMNASRVWGHRPELQERLFALLSDASTAAGLTYRQRAVLVAATASAREDSYCSLAWGGRLAGEIGADGAAGVLQGDDSALDPADRALAHWARTVARDPNGAGPDDVRALREAGFGDAQILALTVYAAGRIALSTVNDALGARPDAEYCRIAPSAVQEAVSYGRPVADELGERGRSNP
jgi:alkylhydroperoxidase family enzyme